MNHNTLHYADDRHRMLTIRKLFDQHGNALYELVPVTQKPKSPKTSKRSQRVHSAITVSYRI